MGQLLSKRAQNRRGNRQKQAYTHHGLQRRARRAYAHAWSAASACASAQGIASGTRHELCYAIHAEQNAIIQAAKLGVSIQDATLYCTHQPCVICAKMIVNAGISRVVYREGYPDDFARQMLLEGGVKLERYEEEEHEQ